MKTIVHTHDNEPPLFGKYDRLETLVSKEQAEIAVADVKEFIEFLHKQAAKHTKEIWFGKEALTGIRGYSSGDSRVKT